MKWHTPTHIDRPTATRCRFRCPLVLHCALAGLALLRRDPLAQRRFLGRAGRIGDGGTGGQRSGDSAAASGCFDAQAEWWMNSKGLYKAEPPQDRDAAAGRAADPEIQGASSRRRNTSRGLRRFSRIRRRRRRMRFRTAEAARRRSPRLRLRWAQGTTQGGTELQRRGRRGFWVAVFVVRGGGAAAHQQQLAAIDGGSQRFGGAAGGGDVHDSARRHGDEHSDDAAQQQLFGGYFGGARGEGLKPAAGAAGRHIRGRA